MSEKSYQPDTHDSSLLPKNWVWTTLGEIGTVASGGTPSTKEPSNFDGEIPWITPADLSGYTKKFIGRGRRNLTKRGLDHSSATLLPAGTVLFSSRAPVGYVAIASNPLTTNQGFKNLILHDWISNEYVYHYLIASKGLAESFASGTTFLEVSGSRFARIPIPLCPTREQCRIVARVEELFSKLDAGVKSLETVKAQLRRYRQSVLKSAFEGGLTDEWRRIHRDKLEPASALLGRIRQEQREKWEEDLRKKGKNPANYEFQDSTSMSSEDLPVIPSGWAWSRVDWIAGVRLGRQRSPKNRPDKYPRKYLRAANIIDGALDLSDVKEMDFKPDEFNVYKLRRGDVLLSEGSGSPYEVGKCAVWDERIPDMCIQNTVIRVRSGNIPSQYLLYVFMYARCKRDFAKMVKGIEIAHLGAERLAAYMIPLAPKNEQLHLCEKIDSLLAITKTAEMSIETALRNTAKLERSLLSRAFRGELLSQDPSDEPANVLLERIKSLMAQGTQDQKVKKERQHDYKQRRLM